MPEHGQEFIRRARRLLQLGHQRLAFLHDALEVAPGADLGRYFDGHDHHGVDGTVVRTNRGHVEVEEPLFDDAVAFARKRCTICSVATNVSPRE